MNGSHFEGCGRPGKPLAFSLATLILQIAICPETLAHERWILTPAEVLEWSSRPKPDLYTSIGLANSLLIGAALLFVLCWIRLGFTGARELFPDLQLRLASYGDYASVILRVCLGWTLLSSAFGMEPRSGNLPFSSPALFAPDLELSLLDPFWRWLGWVEIALGVMFLMGTWVRLAGMALIALLVMTLILFGRDTLAYFTAFLGVAFYLVLQGPGRCFVPLPVPRMLRTVSGYLDKVPRQRAQFLLRILAGLNFLYLGLYFKVLQPNLALAILSVYQVPILSWAPEIFVLVMALVEVIAGLLMIAGILMRPLSLFILGAMFFFASVLPESFTAHMMFYGILLTFLFNSAGHWSLPAPRDRSARIVIVGGGLAAVRAAMRLESLRGVYSNVCVTLIAPRAELSFGPLLPEVIGGSVQPGHVVNSMRRILDRTTVLEGTVDGIDPMAGRICVRRSSGVHTNVDFDQLILAHEPTPNLAGPPGLVAIGQRVDSISDALQLRQRVLEALAEAEHVPEGEARRRQLTVAVVGGGEHGCATALELRRLFGSALSSYRGVVAEDIRIVLFENSAEVGTQVPHRLRPTRDRVLHRMGVERAPDSEPRAVVPGSVVLRSGTRMPCSIVVNARYRHPALPLPGAAPDGVLRAARDLGLAGSCNIWLATPAADTLRGQAVSVAMLKQIGEAAADNAWARTQGLQPHAFRPIRPWVQTFSMGRNSVCSVFGVVFSGRAAWLVDRVRYLGMLPGLELNLRILIDSLLRIPFRDDIAALGPEVTPTVRQIYYEPGDVVIREGERGECAFLVRSGHLEVIENGRPTGMVGPGDCIGEIALLRNSPRTSTVVCISPVTLTVLSKEQFLDLATNFTALGQVLEQQVRARLPEAVATVRQV